MATLSQDSSNIDVRKATRLAMAHRDLRRAYEFLETFLVLASKNPTESVLLDALMSMAVIEYAKPFGGNDGAGIATKNIDLPTGTDINPSLHDLLKKLRNTSVAHGDADRVPVQIVAHDDPSMLLLAEPEPVFDVVKAVDAQNFKRHLDAVCKAVHAQLQQASDALNLVPGSLGHKLSISPDDSGGFDLA